MPNKKFDALLKRFDADIHTSDLAGMACRQALIVLLDNWEDDGAVHPGDVDDVVGLLLQWKAIVAVAEASDAE